MRRILPGDLVSFLPMGPKDSVPHVQVIEARNTKKKYKDAMFNNGAEAARLAEIRKELGAIDPKYLYLVLSASETRTFLMRCDTARYLVAFTKDLINHCDEEDDWL